VDVYIVILKGKPFLVEDDVLTPLQEGSYGVKKVKAESRTILQNSAMHKYFSLLAGELNDAGYTVNYVLNKRRNETIEKVFDWASSKCKCAIFDKMKERILRQDENEVEWTMYSVKDIVWRGIQEVLFGNRSTTLLKSDEITQVYKNVNKVMSDKTGITVAFPSVENMLMEEKLKD